MLNIFRSSRSNVLVWILLGLLIVGLTGFGLSGTVSGLSSQNVARVGDEGVETDTFMRALQNEISRIQQQTGQPIGMAQAQEFGIDRQVLSSLVGLAALDNKAAEMGISVGDEAVREAVLTMPQFAGADGFSQEQYNFALSNQGLTPKEFEADVRKGLTRDVLRQSLVSGTQVPVAVVDRILDYAGETRTFSYVTLTPELITDAPEPPTEADIQAAYAADPDGFQSQEAREVTAAVLTVEEFAESIEVTQEDLQAEYEARQELFDQPARRIVDRLVFSSTEEALTAKARIEAGEVTLADLAAERGLSAQDISQGAVEEADLSGAAKDMVFAEDAPGLVGPVASSLGPALFQINAIIPARVVPLEDVEDILRRSIATILAEDEIADLIDDIDDLVAGGATIEEVANESALILRRVSVTETPGEGLLGDAGFRTEVFEAEIGEERDLISLDDGGLAVVRVEGVTAPTRLPLDAVRDEIAETLTAEANTVALRRLADAVLTAMSDGQSFAAATAAAGYTLETVGPLTRNDQAPGLGFEALEHGFEMSLNKATVLDAPEGVLLMHADDISPFDPDAQGNEGLRDQVIQAFAEQRANDLFGSYLSAVQNSTPLSVNDRLIGELLDYYR
ncbi:MAG: SurA N-terminal domain-containing protein [Pseudomonadota bacterium]